MSDFTKAIIYSPALEGRKLVDFISIGKGDGHLYKRADESQYDPEIVRYIRTMDKKPGFLYALINALGASEFWGSNSNSDAFPEDALTHEGDDYGYKTFVRYARPYKHHINKPDSPAYGEVKHSVYNPRMHRVELVVGVDREKAPDIVDRVEGGEDVPVSMGCKVPYDVCSICGNKAKSTDAYCDDMLTRPNEILPDGRRVCVINLTPKFFDISFVLVGADKTARVMDKVASSRIVAMPYPSDIWAMKMGYLHKGADIIKEIPGEMEGQNKPSSPEIEKINRGVKELCRSEKVIPNGVLRKASSNDLNGVLATLSQAGIVLSPAEFQYLALENSGMGKAAEKLASFNKVFDETPVDQKVYRESFNSFDFGVENTIPKVAEIIAPYLEDRSAFQEFLASRVEERINLPKTPSISSTPIGDSRFNDPSILPLLGSLAAIYAAYRDKVPASQLGVLDKLVAKNPAMLAILAGGTAATVMGINRLLGPTEKTAGPVGILLGVPAAAYLYGAHQQRRQWRGEELNPIQSGFANYPGVASILGIGAVHNLSKMLPKLGSVEISKYASIVRSYSAESLIRSGNMNMLDLKTTLNLISLADAQASR